MTYDPTRTRRLITQTENAAHHATLAEVERANQLAACECEIGRLHAEIARLIFENGGFKVHEKI